MNQDAQIEQARQLILQGQYNDAQAILILIEHPTATELLSRIEDMRAFRAKHPKQSIKKDYVFSAVIVLVLYILFWIVGLLVNVHYLGQARRNDKNPDYEVTGLGCLWSLLLVVGIGPFAAFFCWIASIIATMPPIPS